MQLQNIHGCGISDLDSEEEKNTQLHVRAAHMEEESRITKMPNIASHINVM